MHLLQSSVGCCSIVRFCFISPLHSPLPLHLEDVRHSHLQYCHHGMSKPARHAVQDLPVPGFPAKPLARCALNASFLPEQRNLTALLLLRHFSLPMLNSAGHILETMLRNAVLLPLVAPRASSACIVVLTPWLTICKLPFPNDKVEHRCAPSLPWLSAAHQLQCHAHCSSQQEPTVPKFPGSTVLHADGTKKGGPEQRPLLDSFKDIHGLNDID